MTGRRVVITGIDVLAPGGVGVKQFWDQLNAGRTATRGITFFDPTRSAPGWRPRSTSTRRATA